MGINIRTKGATAEREVADILNGRLYLVMQRMGLPLPTVPHFQRNQNQSAVGGSDLTNKLRLSIEVKRQENLAVNTWWAQCKKASERAGGIPILIYRQSRQAWRVVLMVDVPYQNTAGGLVGHTQMRAEVSWDDFLTWFDYHCYLCIQGGTNVYPD